jgi:hypothetical protein
MRSTPPVAFATWMLEHLTFGSPNESLSGDLLEEFRSGRSAGWYWCQALSAIAVTVFSRFRAYLLPLVFSACWGVLYPAFWPSIVKGLSTQAIFERMATHDWPYSSAFQAVGEIFPAVIFVWIGFFIYLILRNPVAHYISTLQLFGSLSISVNVLFAATVLQHIRIVAIDGHRVSREDFGVHFVALGIPLALSLFSALVCVLPQIRRHGGAAPLVG